MIKTRADIPNLLKPGSIGAELGVFEGAYSEQLLQSQKFIELHLIDIFSTPVRSGDKDGENIYTVDCNAFFRTVKNKFSNNSNVFIHKIDSVTFLQNCESKKIDFIYIDTDHDYDLTTKELNCSLRVIKPGGLICGHDYDQKVYPGCYDAVNDFAKKNGLEFVTTTQDKLASYVFKIPR
jgi:hypothetical protein